MANGEEPKHSSAYDKSHPHIHEVKYKDKNGKTHIYTYRYGTVSKGKNAVGKVRNR
jgi:hypothetical protein